MLLDLTLLAILLVLMIVTGATALFVRDLLAAVVLFSGFSFFSALLYLVLAAPDVAFTEAVIGVVSSAFFIVALRELGRGCSR